MVGQSMRQALCAAPYERQRGLKSGVGTAPEIINRLAP
jgi:hypothetical protein